MTLRRLLVAGVLALIWLSPSHAATTLLPNGKQCFSTANGVVSGGFVNMYIPGTTTFKQTWQDSGQVTLNANPVPLDANGCAVIYGIGSYRQLVQDSALNTVWDQVTTDTSASNSVFIAGLAAGTPNAVTVVDSGFNGTDGIISFIANGTNTGPTTLNPSGFGAIPILKDSTTGPVALSGSEIVAGNVVNVQFSATGNAFHILNLISSISTATPSLCGALGLKITNGASIPSLIAAITADQVIMTNTQGAAITRSNLSLSLNISLAGLAGGTDAGGNVPNTWFYIYAIDNGITTNALASQSATAPAMPSGYSYRCRLGAMRTDGLGNFFRSLQWGADAHWVLSSGSNTTAMPIVLSAVQGNTTVPTFVSTTISGPGVQFAPATATAVDLELNCQTNASFQPVAMVAPNSNYNAYNSTVAVPPLVCVQTSASGLQQIVSGRLWLETNFISYAGTLSTSLQSLGWHDKVNAN